jgi:hypothetical protein
MVHYYLKRNMLAGDSNSYTAVVFQTQVVTEAELARRVAMTIGGITAGQVTQVFDGLSTCVGDIVGDGGTVKTRLFTTSLSVGGTFSGPDAAYRAPGNTTRLHLLASRELSARAESAPRLKHTDVIGGPRISDVVDLFTGEANNEIHPGSLARALGKKVLLQGNSPEVGVAFIGEDGAVTPVPPANISRNTVSEVTFIVPPLPPGAYWLQVTTQYSGGMKQSASPRICTFRAPLTVPW